MISQLPNYDIATITNDDITIDDILITTIDDIVAVTIDNITIETVNDIIIYIHSLTQCCHLQMIPNHPILVRDKPLCKPSNVCIITSNLIK